MAIALSHGGPTIYRSPARSRQVLLGTIQGVVKMERDAEGSGWHVADRTLIVAGPRRQLAAIRFEERRPAQALEAGGVQLQCGLQGRPAGTVGIGIIPQRLWREADDPRCFGGA